MDVIQADITEMKNSSAVVAAALKTLSETLSAMGLWIPWVDTSIASIKMAVDEVAARVAVLEAEQAPEREAPLEDAEAHEPRPKGHDNDWTTQGMVGAPETAPQHALVKVKRTFRNSPVQFDLDDNSEMHISTTHSGYRNTHTRMPKTDFPKLDGDNPQWWRTVAEKYFAMYHVSHETWASFATLHIRGNAALWLHI